MAGNEYYPVRPKAPQDTTKIAAGSPLAVVGLLLEALRARFSEDANLNAVWREDVNTTDILIEAGYNVETEARGATRAIYVNRLRTAPREIAVGDFVGVTRGDSQEFFLCMMEVDFSIDCISADAGDSAMLADIVQSFLLCSGNIFEGWYGFHDFGKPVIGQTQPFQQAQGQWATSIALTTSFQARWSTVKIRPLLQDLGVALQERRGDALVTTALASLQRAIPEGG